MKTCLKNQFLMSVLIASLGLLLSGQVSAQIFTTLHSFSATPVSPPWTNSDGGYPATDLLLAGNTLYGAASLGGSSGNGTVFKVNTDGTGFTNLHSFTDYDGDYPGVRLILSGDTLYGAVTGQRQAGHGAVFRVNTDGTGYTNLHRFTGASDGATPVGGLILSNDTLYGTTAHGGSSGLYGTVFKVNTDGTGFMNLHSFIGGSNGAYPYGGLVLSGNTLYGTTSGLGLESGTVFAVNTDGTGFANLHSFTPYSGTTSNYDGTLPNSDLLLSGDTLYGTAYQGGSSGNGTAFKVNTDGTGFTNLHSFVSSIDGNGPTTDLILSGNTLYGTASVGGSLDHGTVFALTTDDSGFTTLHDFNATSDGANPYGGLILSGNTLYGFTTGGDGGGAGSLFKVDKDGTGFINLHNFDFASDGASPIARLLLSDNTLYGTAYEGGASRRGTVFSLSILPQLNIIRFASDIVLTWPTNYPGFTLQSTTNLVPPAIWITNSPAPVVVNGQNIVTNPVSGTQNFYRLIQ